MYGMVVCDGGERVYSNRTLIAAFAAIFLEAWVRRRGEEDVGLVEEILRWLKCSVDVRFVVHI